MNDNQLRCWLAQARFHVSEPVETDINRPLANSTTPLMYAAQTGDLDVVRSLLKRGADPALLNADGNGALWFACYSDNAACVSELIKAGAPLDTQNVNGATALIYCASAGKTPLVKLLLEAGANTELMTHDDFTALELAADLNCLRLLKNARNTACV
ncbi:MAG: ankyrin repeat domain-containing protein [Sideroxydans sp.]|nr:ankyrin repeat domain-containing protein [Sideroxydans sp.]MDD5472289.1 ankyrin repeat domain-containing protein [Sideroxydans sp.]